MEDVRKEVGGDIGRESWGYGGLGRMRGVGGDSGNYGANVCNILAQTKLLPRLNSSELLRYDCCEWRKVWGKELTRDSERCATLF